MVDLLVISDGGDWTRTVDKVEFPFIRYIYSLYGATDKAANVHLPDEGHDYGPNKRYPMYDFMAKHLGLDRKALQNKEGVYDESPVKQVTRESLLIFPDSHYPSYSLTSLSDIFDCLKANSL